MTAYFKRPDPSRRELLAVMAGAIAGAGGALLSPAMLWGDEVDRYFAITHLLN